MSLFSNIGNTPQGGKGKKGSWFGNFFSGMFGAFMQDIAIDLGTANTLIMHKGEVIINEPSIVAIDKNTNDVIGVGDRAALMHEKTHPHIETIRPLKDGVIADYYVAEKMIREFIKKINEKRKFITPRYRMVICIPSGITEVERRAVKDSAEHAGAREVHLIFEPMAAALGIGIDVGGTQGNMVVDIGGGTTEIAVISLGGIVCDESIRIAGDELNTDIQNYIKTKYNLQIGEKTAEKAKKEIGAAITDLKNPPEPISIKGKDLISGIPRTIEVTHNDIAEAIQSSVTKIEKAVLRALEHTPPELAADIYENGIYLTGGGALLRGLDEKIARSTKLKVHIADSPLFAVVKGAGKTLENLDYYKFLLM